MGVKVQGQSLGPVTGEQWTPLTEDSNFTLGFKKTEVAKLS